MRQSKTKVRQEQIDWRRDKLTDDMKDGNGKST
jgi:hypothetical protein